MPISSSATDKLLSKLEEIYRKRKRIHEFEQEMPIYRRLMPKLLKTLNQTYRIIEPIGLGSTATVWKVTDVGLDQARALKLTRPSKSKSAEIIQIIRDEPIRLASLNHQNIIKVFTSNRISLTYKSEPYEFPFFVMEYLANRADLDEAILSYHGNDWALIVDYFKDALNGIDALHAEKIVHCDIKPGNILVPPGRPALVADLGYAKHLSRSPRGDLTRLITTHRYAHPALLEFMKESSDPSATVIEIKKNQLDRKFDLFAFGRTMQEILCKLRLAERNSAERDFGRESIFTPYQWQYLSIISKRLLDGVVDRSPSESLPHDFTVRIHSPAAEQEIRQLYQDSIPELPSKAMAEIRYGSAAEAIEDVEKLQHLYDLEGRVPELNPNSRSFIQVPHCHVPLTDRVRRVINHPSFQRIAQTTQLGFVTMVYPGARHTRYEHVLGAFWHCCQYIRALWYDQTNPLFQCIMTERDLSSVLLAALIHDVSQYPMAHDLTEIDDGFEHEAYFVDAIETVYKNDLSLADVISDRELWGVDIVQVTNVLNANTRSSFKHRLLRSILDGVLDCDKLDYVRRDSLHLGVSFGLAIDHERLFRNLTTIWGSPTDQDIRFDEHHPGIAEVGVSEKAFVVAKSLMDVRKDMFRQVYWQHTTRTLKAMLGFVVRGILIEVQGRAKEPAFWREVQGFVMNPARYYSPAEDYHAGATNSSKSIEESSVPIRKKKRALDIGNTLRELLEDDPADYPAELSSLDPSDDSLLNFLWKHATPAGKRVINDIRNRRIYERAAVVAHSRHPQAYEQLYEQFRQWRLARNTKNMEEQRKAWEHEIKAQTLAELTKKSILLPRGQRLEEVKAAISAVDPLVLVDVPIRATSKQRKPKYLRFVREDPFVSHRFHHGSYPQFESFELEKDDTSFDIEVGKIRVLCHPEWRDLLIWVLGEELRAIIVGR